jgi:tripartite-type tricarboxylate transporter receptor subunit TctC
MLFERRSVLALSAYALAFGQASLARASASEISSLRLVNYAGTRSFVWAILDILRPALQQQLKCKVELETIDGHAGFDTVESIRVVEPGKPKLFCGSIMGMQYAEKVKQRGALLESLTPIARLTNGYSVTLFAKRGSRFKAWPDLATAAPLRVCAPVRPAPGYLAELMMEHSSGLKIAVTGGMKGVQSNLDDVLSGQCDVGILAMMLVVKQLDQLQPIVSFGAARNAALGQTPTFAEVTGNPKLAFTESVGAFASPKIDPAVAALLTKAFLAVGENGDVIDRAEAEDLPLSIGGPEVLVDTMKRNESVLQRILG